MMQTRQNILQTSRYIDEGIDWIGLSSV